MRSSPVPGILFLFGSVFLAAAMVPSQVLSQVVEAGVRDAYFGAVAEHFGVPKGEVAIVGDWELDTDEVPVVFFVSRSAGVSPDALIGLRRSGLTWREVATRFGLGVRNFHISLPEDVTLGSLTRSFGEFRGRPYREWDQIQLDDMEIISLVNLRVLSEQLGVAPLRVLQSREEAGSFVSGFASLRGRTPARPLSPTPF